MRARHRASVKAAHARPEVKAKILPKIRAYWDDPANRKAASEIQCEMWKDTMVRGRRLVGVERAWESQERREKQRQSRLKDWETPEFRNRTVKAMQSGRRAAIPRRVIELAQKYPEMTPQEIAQRVRRKIDGVLHILRVARRKGQIDVRPGDGPRLRKRAGLGASVPRETGDRP